MCVTLLEQVLYSVYQSTLLIQRSWISAFPGLYWSCDIWLSLSITADTICPLFSIIYLWRCSFTEMGLPSLQQETQPSHQHLLNVSRLSLLVCIWESHQASIGHNSSHHHSDARYSQGSEVNDPWGSSPKLFSQRAQNPLVLPAFCSKMITVATTVFTGMLNCDAHEVSDGILFFGSGWGDNTTQWCSKLCVNKIIFKQDTRHQKCS